MQITPRTFIHEELLPNDGDANGFEISTVHLTDHLTVHLTDHSTLNLISTSVSQFIYLHVSLPPTTEATCWRRPNYFRKTATSTSRWKIFNLINASVLRLAYLVPSICHQTLSTLAIRPMLSS